MNRPDLQTLGSLIRRTARQELLSRFTHTQRQFKPDGSVLTEADLAMQQQLSNQLQAHWPQIELLGEEMSTQQQQALLETGQPLWIVDPLDGTSNYASGIPYFSVSVALLMQGEIVLGVIYDPSRDELFSAERGQGAWLNGEPLRLQSAPPLERCVAICDLKRLSPTLAQRIACHPPFASQRSFGSVALDWCWIAAGRGQLYLHGRQQLWDYAAASLILQEAGGVAATLEGEAVFQASLIPRSTLAAMDVELFQAWQQWLQQVIQAG